MGVRSRKAPQDEENQYDPNKAYSVYALQVTDQDRLQQEACHSIHRAVKAGNVDEALRLTEGAAPGLLTAEPPLQIGFQLKVLKFIELVSHLCVNLA